MWTRAFAPAAVATALAAAPVDASQEPLSAIDWLSRSIAEEPIGVLPPPVTVAPLERAPTPIGVVSPDNAGVPLDIWSGSRASDVVAAIQTLPTEMPRPVGEEVALLMQVAAPAPESGDDLLLARIDRLLALGRVHDAEALIAAAGQEDPALFRRRFDIALLTGAENAACQTLETRPDIAPTYPARIFCLARRGDWPAAALTLETAEALDVLTDSDTIIMARFLDDGEADLLPPPERPQTISPLVFRLYEAIGEQMVTRSLPIAFAHADLRPQNGWKTRLEAAERLFRAGAIPAEDLLALYHERAPAASGGVWDRAAAVQAMTAADVASRREAVGNAQQVLAAAGLGHLLEDLAPSPDREKDAGPLAAEPDADLADLISDGRTGEAALSALSRAAEAWRGDPRDLAQALATLDAAGLGEMAERLRRAATFDQ